MTGLFTGIIGSLVGAGIQATIGGIPIQEDTSKALDVLRNNGLPVPPANWFSPKSSDEQRTQLQVANNFGQHVTGAMQMLGPCMQIAKSLADAAYPRSQVPAVKEELARSKASCKSAEVDDPMLLLTRTMTNVKKECSDSRCLRSSEETSSTRSFNIPITKNCKPRENFCSESIKRAKNKETRKTVAKIENVPSKASIKNKANSLVKDNILRKAHEKKSKTNLWERDIKADKIVKTAGISKDSKRQSSAGPSSTVTHLSPIIPKSQTKTFKLQDKFGKSFCGKKCPMCEAQIIRDIKKSPSMPCGRVARYKSLIGPTLSECPKCGFKFE